MELIGFF